VFIKVAASFDECVDKLHIDRADVLDVLASHASKPSHVYATEEYLDIALPRWRDDAELVRAIDGAKKRIARDSATGTDHGATRRTKRERRD
jgi:hypothetical protein